MIKVRFKNILDCDEVLKMQLLDWRNQDFVRDMMFTRDIIDKDSHMKFLNSLKEENNIDINEGNKNTNKEADRINKLVASNFFAYRHKGVYIGFVEGKPFGVVQFQLHKDTGIMDFGYYLIEQKNINSGLGIVLEYVILNHAFYKINAYKVLSKALIHNKKVIELHSKFGFLTDTIQKDCVKIGEEYFDVCFQSIERASWEQNISKIEKAIKVLFQLEEIEELCCD